MKRITTRQFSVLADCGQCEKMCPQYLPVREWLIQVAKRFIASMLAADKAKTFAMTVNDKWNENR